MKSADPRNYEVGDERLAVDSIFSNVGSARAMIGTKDSGRPDWSHRSDCRDQLRIGVVIIKARDEVRIGKRFRPIEREPRVRQRKKIGRRETRIAPQCAASHRACPKAVRRDGREQLRANGPIVI